MLINICNPPTERKMCAEHGNAMKTAIVENYYIHREYNDEND
jgi:hypothetical protein